jgi:hypothetical protein
MPGSRVVARYVPVIRTIVGTDEDLTRLLRRQSELGRLLTPPSELRPVRIKDGRWEITVRLARPLTGAEVRSLWWAGHRSAIRLTAGILLAITVLLALGAIAVQAVIRTITAAGAGSVGALILAALVLLWLTASAKRGHPCKGLHCQGCKGRH